MKFFSKVADGAKAAFNTVKEVVVKGAQKVAAVAVAVVTTVFAVFQAAPAGICAVAVVAAASLVSGSAFATDPIVIEDVGNAGGYIEAAITALGIIAGSILAGFFGFWLVKKTMSWAGRIG